MHSGRVPLSQDLLKWGVGVNYKIYSNILGYIGEPVSHMHVIKMYRIIKYDVHLRS